jgi:HEAT repeat protein
LDLSGQSLASVTVGPFRPSCTSQDVQGKAAIALGYLGLSNGFRILIETLRESQSSYIRSGAARALGIIGDAAALDALILAIEEDAVIGVRNDAVEAIRIIGNPTQRVNDALIAILRDSDWHLVWNAVLALSRVGDQQAIPELERLFQEAPSWWNFYDQEVSGTIGNAAQYAIEQIELRNK